ncbi:MAG: AI-2E family transporter, partial [Candidatus Pacebacteria bacterium]|nr:AI-2E family transporter [Candidatus Paceibacterota bacterium]
LTLAMVPALFLAWTHGGLHLLWVTGLIYFIISQVESHILYPKIMSKMVGVPSVVVIIAIVVGAKIAGLWGVLLAVPLASILMELASDLEKQKSHDN